MRYKLGNKGYNEYEKFINKNSLFIKSKIQSLFSGKTKSYSIYTMLLNIIENIFFNFFIDVNIYLEPIRNKNNISDVLDSNYGILSNLSIECKCFGKENTIQ